MNARPPFERVRPLGAGATGQVHLARLLVPLADRPAGAEVAVKTLHPQLRDDEEAARALAAEAETGGRVRHPSLARPLQYGVGPDGPYLVMEFVPGRSLGEILEVEGPLPEPTVRHVGAQLAGALAALHAAGLAHGDLKPDNVRLDDAGNAVLLDLGYATHFAAPPSSANPGSLAWLSPERAVGGAPSPAADVFALGLVLHELATDVHPYLPPVEGSRATSVRRLARAGSSSGGVLRRSLEIEGADRLLASLATTRPVPPSTWQPRLSPLFDALVLALLARAPEHRPNASEAAERFEGGERHPWWRARFDPAEAEQRSATGPEALHLTPMVGRDEELARLEACLHRLVDPAGRSAAYAVWLTGPEGSGKWRLVSEFARRVRAGDDPPLYLFARWTREAEARRGGALSSWLRRWLQLPVDAAPGERARDLLARRLPEESVEALLAALDPEREDTGGPGVAALLGDWLAALGREGPVIAFLDDLHLARDVTLSALSALLGRLRETRVLLVLGVREDIDYARPALIEHLRERLFEPADGGQHAERVELGPLDEEEVGALVKQLFHPTAPRLRLAHVLWLRSRGNPGLLAELLRNLVASGDAYPKSEDEPALVLAIAPDRLPLPSSLDRIIAERARVLAPEERRWLDRLSVVGGHLDAAFLLRAFPLTTRAEVDEVLARLVRTGWLVPAADRYRFARPALRDAVVSALSPERRLRLHAAAARGLAPRPGAESSQSDEEIFQRAYHLRAAEEPEVLLEVLAPLVRRLVDQASPQRLLTLARWGLEALEDVERTDDDLRLELLEVAAGAADRLGRREEQRELLDHLVDTELDLERQPAQGARLYLLHGRFAAGTGQLGLARGMLRTAGELARESGEALLISEVQRRQALVQAQIGELGEARELAEAARAAAADATQEALAKLALVVVEILEDRLEEALIGVAGALALLRETRDRVPGIVAHAFLLRARAWRSLGFPRRAHDNAQKSMRFARQAGERRLEAEASARLGGLEVLFGRAEEAEALLRDALLQAVEIEDRRGAVLARLFLGTLLCEAEAEGAVQAVRRANREAEDIGFHRALALGLAISARHRLQEGDSSGAERESARALVLVERHGAELVDRIAVVGTRALVLHQRGREGEAKDLVRALRRRMRETNARLHTPIRKRTQRRATTGLLEAALSPEGPLYPRESA
jgi:serine/threonine protein kinase